MDYAQCCIPGFFMPFLKIVFSGNSVGLLPPHFPSFVAALQAPSPD